MSEQTFWSDPKRGARRPSLKSFGCSLVFLAAYFCLLPVDSLPEDQFYLSPVFFIIAIAPILLGLRARYRFSPVMLFASVSLFFLSVHWLFSDWPWMSLWLGGCLALLPIGVLIASSAAAKKHIERALPGILIVVASANALFILYQVPVVERRPGGFLEDPNLGANIVAIGVLCAAYLYLSKRVSHLALLLIAIMSSALFFAQSRGAWIALIVSGSILSLVFIISGQRERQRLLFFGLALLAGFAVAFYLAGAGLAESVGIGVRSQSLGYRLEIWGSAWELFLQRPLLGSGIGTFPLRYPAVRSPLETSTTGHFAHSDILQLFVELGFFGALLFLLVPIVFVVSFGASIRKHGTDFGLPLLAFNVLVLVGLHGLVNFVIYQPLIAFAVGLLIGASGRGAREIELTLEAPARRLVAVFSVAISSLILAMSSADLMATKKIVHIVQSEGPFNLQSNAYYDLLLLEMFSPLNVNIKNFIVDAEVASAMGLVGTDMGPPFRKQIIERIEHSRRYYDPNCVQQSARGRLLWLDDQGRAVSALESLIHSAPNCYRAYIFLSEAYLNQRRFSDAEQLLEGALARFKFGEVSKEQASALLDALAETLRRQGKESEARAIEAFSRAS